MIQACIHIQEHTHVAEVRRIAQGMAHNLLFDDTLAGNLSLIVTEAATNLLKHAQGGQMILRLLADGGEVGIEMLAVDKGPGIADIPLSFKDGYSTAGSNGTGLGAIARLSNIHEIYSRRDQGTVLMAQLWKRGLPPGPARTTRFRGSGVSVALHGEEYCGDAWLFQDGASGSRTLVADGLGHGPLASDAAQAAIRVAQQFHEPAPRMLERIHAALRSTRGAAVAIADIDPSARVVRFAGVGNITGTVVPESGPSRHLVSHAGTAGHEVRKIQEFTYPWDRGAILIMHSDGLQTHWSFDRYPGLRERHPSLIAGVLYRDYTRGRDDVTVVVVREEASRA